MRGARVLGLLFSLAVLQADDFTVNPQIGIEVEHEINGKKVSIKVERSTPLECIGLKMTPENITSGNLAGSHIPKECKIEVVTTAGSIQPMSIADGVKTIGELEVLNIMALAKKEPTKYALVDARKSDWYEQMTIPSAINIPFTDLEYDPIMEADYYAALAKMGVKRKDKGLDFKDAKIVAVFCTGALCVQSKGFIQRLMRLGYPRERLLWYRGGIQDWVAVGMSVLKAENIKK